MKTIKLFAMAAIAVVIGLSSCKKNEGAPQPSDEQQFKVTLRLQNAETRADGALAVAGTKVGINDGYICFVSANDAITDVYTISGDPTSGKNIQNSDLGSTAVILEGVPGTSVNVYMIANKGAVANFVAPAVGGTMTSYMANNMDVRDQGLYTGVTSVGNAALVAGSDPNTKTAAITLSTDVSRIQIKGITFNGEVTGKVAGIFINGYYPTMQLNGTAGTLAKSNIDVDYNEVSGSAIFPIALKTFVFDDLQGKTFNATVSTPATVVPTTANGAWGYNLFKSATPQIIIKLTDVVVGGQALAADQFITINGFKNTTTSAVITELEGGMIYTISTESLVIKYENMSIDPGVTPINVEVTVIPVTWKVTDVIPNI